MVVSRKFGVRPDITNGELDKAFEAFSKTVNAMIKHGLKQDDELFRREGLISVTKFYNSMRTIPIFNEKLKKLNLRERARRCATQFAYFSVREYKIRTKMMSDIAAILLSHENLSLIVENNFPSSSLINLIKKKIPRTSGNGKRWSYEFLKSLLLQFKNVVKTMLERKSQENISKLLNAIQISDFHDDLQSWVKENKAILLKSFVRRTSLLLTKRVKWLLRKSRKLSKASWRDDAIGKILQGNELTQKSWEVNRKPWRDSLLKELEQTIKKFNIEGILSSSFEDISSSLTPKYVIKNISTSHFRRTIISGISLDDFMKFLQSASRIQLEGEIVKSVKEPLLLEVRRAIKLIHESPRRWVKKPFYRKQTISFALDDGQVYDLTFDKTKPDVNLHLSFKSREQIKCTLETPERFHTMIKRGFRPLRGFLTKKNGYKLVLTIPFSKIEDEKDFSKDTEEFKVGGLDLGLKTLGVLSIAPCTIEKDGSMGAVGKEIKNYFIDQKQLLGSRDFWLKNNAKNGEPFNVKRRLTNLQGIAYNLQSKMDLYKQAHPKNYRNKVKFFKLRREWKRVWQKIQNLHEELARQVATRVVAACQLHDVKILNVEDLSWAKHGKKSEVGYFLRTNQIHWHFARIQDIIISRARQEGIIVNKVNARNTSKRCSRCGELGSRSGKRFSCSNCGMKLDSDLNAARNILRGQFFCSHEPQKRVPVPTHSLS